jgi:hypothetical protein
MLATTWTILQQYEPTLALAFDTGRRGNTDQICCRLGVACVRASAGGDARDQRTRCRGWCSRSICTLVTASGWRIRSGKVSDVMNFIMGNGNGKLNERARSHTEATRGQSTNTVVVAL